jgi:hypothetical protein
MRRENPTDAIVEQPARVICAGCRCLGNMKMYTMVFRFGQEGGAWLLGAYPTKVQRPRKAAQLAEMTIISPKQTGKALDNVLHIMHNKRINIQGGNYYGR